MEKIAVICCYNNQKILDTMLEAGLAVQENCIIERVFYNNCFSSAAEAYNHAIDHTDAEYMVFVHQDIRFLESDFLSKVIESLKQNPNRLYGLCGTRLINGQSTTFSNVFHGLQNKNIGLPIQDITQVNGLDEIFVAFHRSITEKIRFDSAVFNGWHLFVADFCLQAQANDIPVVVLPYKTQHKNFLEMPKYMMVYRLYPKEYYYYLRRLRKKHKKTSQYIITPCYTANLRSPLFSIKIFFHCRKTEILRKIRKATFK